MGAELQAERESEYQYELSKLCGYLFDGFGAENKMQCVPDKEAHYWDKDSALFRKKKTGWYTNLGCHPVAKWDYEAEKG